MQDQKALKAAYDDWQSKKAPWYMPTPKGNMEERAAEQRYSDLLSGKSQGFNPVDQQIPKAGTPAATNPGAQQPAGLGFPTKKPAAAPATPVQAAAPVATAPAAQEIAPGVYRHGRGQYSDSPEGMGFKPGFTGQPSARDDAAMQAVAQRNGMGFRPADPFNQAQPVAQTQPSGSGFGLLDADARATRAAMMDAQQLKPGSGTRLKSLLQQQQDAPKLEIERQRTEQMAGDSAAERSLKAAELAGNMGFRSAQMADQRERTGIERERAAVDMEARGFEVSQARRLENLRKQYEATQDPKVKADLAQRIRTMMGKDDQQNRFTVVPGGQEYDPQAMVMRNVPARVLNNQTGQFVDGGQRAQSGALPLPPKEQLKAGQVYSTPEGDLLFDGKKFTRP